MYTFFDMAGTAGAKVAAFASAVTLSAIMMATAIVPASPANPLVSGVLA